MKISLRFIATPTGTAPAVLEKVQLLRRAILECKPAQFRYFARFAEGHKAVAERREVNPHGLAFVNNSWYLIAQDLKHDDTRRFRLDRMDNLSLLDKTFPRPSTEDLLREQRSDKRDELTLTVQAMFDASIARWVRESRSWFAIDECEVDEGLLVTFKLRHESELLQYLLQWGGAVTVLEPESLRLRLVDEARKMLAKNAA